MKNKFRRSLTSVLLAASLLFSSQSVIAFADYGSKSDASDLSPVQEKNRMHPICLLYRRKYRGSCSSANDGTC